MDEDDEILPVALMSKPKLKSFNFANSLATLFKGNTLKEIDFNTKKSSTCEKVQEVEEKKSSKFFEREEKSTISEKILDKIETPQKTTINAEASTNLLLTEHREILNENNKRLREEEADFELEEERDLKRPNFSQIDYREKKYLYFD